MILQKKAYVGNENLKRKMAVPGLVGLTDTKSEQRSDNDRFIPFPSPPSIHANQTTPGIIPE